MQLYKFFLPTSKLGWVSQRFSTAEVERLLCLERIHLEQAGSLPPKKIQEIVEDLKEPFMRNLWGRSRGNEGRL